VSLVEGSLDIGGTRTSLAMQLAEALGITAEDVKPTVADTDMVANRRGPRSRVTFRHRWAATSRPGHQAADDRPRRPDLGVKPEDVAYDAGVLRCEERRRQALHPSNSWPRSCTRPAAPSSPGERRSDRRRRGFATHVVDVEVDPRRAGDGAAVHGVQTWRAIHPATVEGQMQAVRPGIGWALNEEYAYNAKAR